MGLRGLVILSVVVSAALMPGVARAFDTSLLGLDGMADELIFTEKEIKGNWGEKESWRGTLCNGYYRFESQLNAGIKTVDIQLQDDGSLKVKMDLRDLYARVDGNYKSEASLCLPVHGWNGVRSDFADIDAIVTFVDRGENQVPEIKVNVIKTKLGRIHIGSWVPQWFEDVLTNVVNSGLKKVWASSLGDWLEKRIAKAVAEKFPKP